MNYCIARGIYTAQCSKNHCSIAAIIAKVESSSVAGTKKLRDTSVAGYATLGNFFV